MASEICEWWSNRDDRLVPTLVGLLAGFVFAMYTLVDNEDVEPWVLNVAVVVGFFAALLGDDQRPRFAAVGWFANGFALWAVGLLAVRAGGFNLAVTLGCIVVVLALLLVARVVALIDR